MEMDVTEVAALGERIKNNVSKVIAGKDNIIVLAVTALFAGGHLLLDDVPGTGKTMLAKSLAKSLNVDFRRVQFVPDLLPSDLTGINYYNQKQGDFMFHKGPVFTNILLADEINRATPRTQSSLLECMEEQQVSVDGATYKLASPYFVIATQNPVETQGTFPLPEAQLDRFLFCTSIGYPSAERAALILKRFDKGDPFGSLSAICGAGDIINAQNAVRDVFVHPDLINYIIEAVGKTRSYKGIALGVSPRGSIAMLRACKAYAAISGRNFVTPEDIKYLAPYIFAHRLVLQDDYLISSSKPAEIIYDIFSTLTVPSEKWDENSLDVK